MHRGCQRLGYSKFCKYKNETNFSIEENYRLENSKLRGKINTLEVKLNSADHIGILNHQEGFKNDEHNLKGQNEVEDPILDLTTNFQTLEVSKNHMAQFGPTSRYSLSLNDPIFKTLVNEKVVKRFKIKKEHLAAVGISTGMEDLILGSERNIITKDEIETKKLLQSKIEDILPDKYLCDLILKNAFKIHLFIWLPMDESLFLELFSSILDTTTIFKNLDNFEIKKRYKFKRLNSNGFIILGIFLILLRIGYINLPYMNKDMDEKFNINKNHNDDKFSPIIKNKIDIDFDYIRLSQKCVSFSFFSKNSINLLYYLLYFRSYCFMAPELGEGMEGEDHSIILGRICEISISIGLYRDPENLFSSGDDIHNDYNDELFNFQWRKLWLMVIVIDMFHSGTTGRPFLMNEDFCDTKLPQIFININPELKPEVEFSKMIYKLCSFQKEIIHLSLDLKKDTKRSKMEQIAEKMLEYCLVNIPSFTDLLVNDPISNKDDINYIINSGQRMRLVVIRIKYLTQIHICYYILYLNCGPNDQNLNNRYYKYAGLTALVLFHFCLKYLNNCHEYFGYEIVTIVAASTLRCMQRVSLFIISILLRSISKEYKYSVPYLDFILNTNSNSSSSSFTIDNNNDNINQLINSEDFLKASENTFISLIIGFEKTARKFSNRYFQAWKVSALAFIMIKVFKNQIKQEDLEFICKPFLENMVSIKRDLGVSNIKPLSMLTSTNRISYDDNINQMQMLDSTNSDVNFDFETNFDIDPLLSVLDGPIDFDAIKWSHNNIRSSKETHDANLNDVDYSQCRNLEGFEGLDFSGLIDVDTIQDPLFASQVFDFGIDGNEMILDFI